VPPDTTKALVDTLNVDQTQLLVTSGHATERDWQIGYRFEVRPLDGDRSFQPINTKGSQRGGRPLEPFPLDVKGHVGVAMDIESGIEHHSRGSLASTLPGHAGDLVVRGRASRSLLCLGLVVNGIKDQYVARDSRAKDSHVNRSYGCYLTSSRGLRRKAEAAASTRSGPPSLGSQPSWCRAKAASAARLQGDLFGIDLPEG
jgi:hypothetical protein